MRKTKLKTEISPKGIFVYPWLTKPDTEYNAAGEYKLSLRVGAEEAAPLMKLIDDAVAANLKAVEKDKGKKVKRVDPPYIVEDDGTVLFRFKMTASGKRKDSGEDWSQKPVLKDHKLSDLSDDVSIWGGTVGRVAFSIFPYFVAGTGAGVKLRLKAVQVIKLVSGGSDFGFDEEPGEDADEDVNTDAAADSEGFTEDADSNAETDGADF